MFSTFSGCYAHSNPSFFHSSRAFRSLLSFPTRRSSDLVGRRGFGAHAGVRAQVPATVPDPGGGTVAGTCARTDRKSTRLNSSHTVISYAVFCLKKKKVRVGDEAVHRDDGGEAKRLQAQR